MPRSLIAVILLTAPVDAATIQQVQAALSACKTAQAEARRNLARIDDAPQNFKNVARTREVLYAVVANAEECIRERQPRVDAHFAALDAAEKAAHAETETTISPRARPPRIKRLRPEPVRPRFPLAETATTPVPVAASAVSYLVAAALWPALFPAVTFGGAICMGGAILLAALTGLKADIKAFSDEEYRNLQRYHDGNRDQEIVRNRGTHAT